MLIQQTISILEQLRLFEMVKAIQEQEKNSEYEKLDFYERLGFIADRELLAKQNRLLDTRLRKAKLRQQAVFEDIDYKVSRGVKRSHILELGTGKWVRNHENLLITGPTGVGKTYLGCAIAHKACQNGFSVIYYRLGKLMYELSLNRGEGSYLKTLKKISKIDILVLDDWGLEMLNKEQRYDLLEILEDRHGLKSTLITSQLPIDAWHSFIGDQTLADAIMDRLIHSAQILNLKGESMRKKTKNKTKT